MPTSIISDASTWFFRYFAVLATAAAKESVPTAISGSTFCYRPALRLDTGWESTLSFAPNW